MFISIISPNVHFYCFGCLLPLYYNPTTFLPIDTIFPTIFPSGLDHPKDITAQMYSQELLTGFEPTILQLVGGHPTTRPQGIGRVPARQNSCLAV